ncbi:cytochrome C [Helicobacter sp. MIT 11-5569]|uniref:diheme cytochrome c n=1 Tax=Helicobacter sp. MIT 11-5569 TaxID=1548151 RepID=UPI00051FD7F9|nr:diheme cytochrome c [Helicobacter sp. MIT 11-5569]TLD85162.1 cytochrome C [Helicobacter sp. MIT 11-5569]
MKNLPKSFCIILLCAFFGVSLNAKSKGPEVKPVDNPLYKKECASCHFGYQPGLLPSPSWKYIMENLSSHYGTDASLEKEEIEQITKYLLDNASEKAPQYRRSAKLTNSMQPGVLYTSISQIPYHQKKHRKLKEWMVTQKEVGNIARCAACHTKADEGVYGKRTINIPNYGMWRD